MLKYQLNKQTLVTNTVDIPYYNYQIIDNVVDNDDKIYINLYCYDVSNINVGDSLTLTFNYGFMPLDDENQSKVVGGHNTIVVESVDYINNIISFMDDKYTYINLVGVTAKKVDDITYIYFSFRPTHFFSNSDTNISINVTYDNKVTSVLNGLVWVNNYTLSWMYDMTVENIDEILDALFDYQPIGNIRITGNPSMVVVSRERIKWKISDINMFGGQTLFTTRGSVKLNIPFSLKTNTDLYQESNIKEYFVQHEEEKAVNSPIEMEKYVYTPVIVKSKTSTTETYEDCVKINFNLHFRVHSGDDWTVNDSDSWNFVEYGDNDNWSNNKYYSYAQYGHIPNNIWNRSCQSDLLKYLGFTTNDVKYQKNKLKKSFLRLSFYDSDDAGSQSLLAYSTVFMDCNKLYSKFVSRSNFECYFDDNGDIVKGIKAEREVNTGSQYVNGSLMNILDVSSMNKEDIEDYRLSSQITTKNKYLSDNSSEGFYLYTWELSDIPSIPTDIYMKVEFNHAGYGRNIPMMAPYRDGQLKGFKTNDEIITDWSSGGGYGIKKYTRYSYIHLKAKYDINTKRHIYYLDPETYGVNPSVDGNVININLYEARINFS